MFLIRKMTEEDVQSVSEIESVCFSDPWSLGTIKEAQINRFDTWLVLLEGDTVI